MRVQFEEVVIRATKRWTDQEGKKRQETKKFYQTLNPFNTDKNGCRKSREQILAELSAQRDAWLEGK